MCPIYNFSEGIVKRCFAKYQRVKHLFTTLEISAVWQVLQLVMKNITLEVNNLFTNDLFESLPENLFENLTGNKQ